VGSQSVTRTFAAACLYHVPIDSASRMYCLSEAA